MYEYPFLGRKHISRTHVYSGPIGQNWPINILILTCGDRGRETQRIWGKIERYKLRGNFTIFFSFLSCPMGGVYIVQDNTKSQMGVVTPTYLTLSHLYSCTQKVKYACVDTIPHTHTLHIVPYTLHLIHYTLTLPYTYTGNSLVYTHMQSWGDTFPPGAEIRLCI